MPPTVSGWQGPHYPNSTTNTCCFGGDLESGMCPTDDPCPPGGETDCSDGCLYEVRSDPTEHHELVGQQYAAKKYALTKRIEELKESAFTPVRCTCDDGFGGISCGGASCADTRACDTALGKNGGFWGPFVDV